MPKNALEGGSKRWWSIKQVIQAVSQEQNPSAALNLLLDAVVALTSASAGRIYLLYLNQSKYRLEAEVTNDASPRPSSDEGDIGVDVLESGASRTLIEKAIITQTSIMEAETLADRFHDGQSTTKRSRMIIPIVRNGSCLGALDLERRNGSRFTVKDQHTAETAGAIIISLLEKRFSLELLKAAQTPINFYQPLNEFLQDILLLISEASSMPFVALRELEGGDEALRCIAHHGLGDYNNSVFDFDPLPAFPTFLTVIRDQKPVVEPDIDAPHLENIRSKPELEKVKSFVVVPVLVGTEMFGTLSFAAACRYNYSPLEIAGFQIIANGIGIAISNFRNAEALHDIFVRDTRLAVSITALEVAQAARHEARNHIDTCSVSVATLLKLLQKPKENSDSIRLVLQQLGDELHALASTMDKIKEASKVPTEELTSISIKELWNEAIALVSGRVAVERVGIRSPLKESTIEGYREQLRHAFLHLLLNSLDAFRDRRIKADRTISITIDPGSADSLDVKIRYLDNATGIDLSKLQVPSDVEPSTSVKQLIFEPGVTSKTTGSGFGLYIVRRILKEHNASIDLIDWRNGVVFDITLPKRQTLAVRERRNGAR